MALSHTGPFPFAGSAITEMTTRPSNTGFTFIELIVIVMILGVLALAVSGRFAERAAFDARGYFDQLVAATRYAQRYAVASGCTVRIEINADSHALTTQDAICGFGTVVQSPAGGAFTGNAPSGVSVTAGAGSYDFDARGNVSAGGGVTVAGGGNAISFTITPGSGFVVTP